MLTAKNKIVFLYLGLISMLLLSGCTNWKKKYQGLNVEHQNIKGLYERVKAERGQLSQQVSQSHQTIEELQRQIVKQQSTAKASGFGEDYDVSFDSSAGTVTVTLPNMVLFSSGKASLKKAILVPFIRAWSI